MEGLAVLGESASSGGGAVDGQDHGGAQLGRDDFVGRHLARWNI